MARARNPDRDKAFEIYKSFNTNIKSTEIATKLGVSNAQIRKWKSQDKWDYQIGTLNINEKILDSVMDNETLNDKQKLFCICYLRNFNVRQSAINAGYSYDTAYSIGYNLLNNPDIKAEIQRLKAIKAESILIDQDDIIERYMKIAFSDMTDFVSFGQESIPVMTRNGPLTDENGNEVTKDINTLTLKNSHMIDGGIISQVTQNSSGISLKLEDRQKALDWLSKYFLMNPMDRHKVDFDTKKLGLETEKLSSADTINPIEIIIKKASENEL